MKQTIRFALLFSLFVGIIACSKNSTKPQTVTFSGTVTLQGRTDHSGATVMLFKPITLDTALTNLNSRYPGIGITINQRTEFYWREHSPVYRTTTNASGNWKIENVAKGEYHIVVQADSFGWRIKYNASAGTHNFTLSKAIRWSGTYSQNVTVPAGSFVKVVGNTVFTDAATLTIEPGVIVEFIGNNVLEIQGKFICDGYIGQEIMVISENESNSNRIKIVQSPAPILDYLIVFNLSNGFYLNGCDSLTLSNIRIRDGLYAFEIVASQGGKIKNNCITGMTEGIVEDNSENVIEKNLIHNIENDGCKLLNARNTILTNNVIQNCQSYAVGINPEGYGYTNTRVEIYRNDFKKNKSHVMVGATASCVSGENNYIDETDFIVKTSAYALGDTLNFQNNYWSYTNQIDISDKILDKNDRLGQQPEGPLVDFTNFAMNYINW